MPKMSLEITAGLWFTQLLYIMQRWESYFTDRSNLKNQTVYNMEIEKISY